MSTDLSANPALTKFLPDGYTVKDGRLHLHGYDLAAMADYWLDHAGLEDAPLTIRYIPHILANVEIARAAFAEASRETGYTGQVRLAYASKANPNEAVIRAAIGSGADYECSSRVDSWIIRYAIKQGWLTHDQMIIANGFKTPAYADELISLAV